MRQSYIRITTFSEQTSLDVKAIDDLQAETTERLTGLVLDLRNNQEGCCLKQSRIDAFLEKGEIVSTRNPR